MTRSATAPATAAMGVSVDCVNSLDRPDHPLRRLREVVYFLDPVSLLPENREGFPDLTKDPRHVRLDLLTLERKDLSPLSPASTSVAGPTSISI